MEIGIFGLPSSGKTTLFSLLTGTEPQTGHKMEATTGVAKIYDVRVDELSKIFNPKKTVYATLGFVDMPAFDMSANQKDKNRIFQFIQNSDAVLAVVRAFVDPSVPWPLNCETPRQQFDTIKSELLLRDMEVVENRIARLEEATKKRKLSKEEERERELTDLILKAFEEEKFVTQMGLADEDLKLLGSLALFTAKPIIVSVNVDEEQFKSGDFPEKSYVEEECSKNGFAFIVLSGKIEAEINGLDTEDRELFMSDLGIEESGIQRLSSVVYKHVGLISFLTVGEDEVRAWTINKNMTAKAAAGKIHSDLEKNFIKAEMISYETFMEVRDMHEAKTRGLIKLAGKEEIVNDGDIMHVRANA